MSNFTRKLTDAEYKALNRAATWAREVVQPALALDTETGVLLDLKTCKRITATKQRKLKKVA